MHRAGLPQHDHATAYVQQSRNDGIVTLCVPHVCSPKILSRTLGLVHTRCAIARMLSAADGDAPRASHVAPCTDLDLATLLRPLPSACLGWFCLGYDLNDVVGRVAAIAELLVRSGTAQPQCVSDCP